MGKAKQSQSIWEILLNLLRNKEDWGTTVDKSQAKCLAVNLSACLLSVYIILVRANWFWYPRRKWQYWVRIERKQGCSLFPQGKLAPVPPNSMYTLCRWVGLPSCHSCDYGWCGSAVDSPIYPVKLDTHVLPSFLIETVGEQQCELGYYLGNRLS